MFKFLRDFIFTFVILIKNSRSRVRRRNSKSREYKRIGTELPYLSSRDTCMYYSIIYLFILFSLQVVQARREIPSSLLARHSRIERFLSSSPQQFAKLQNAQGYEYATRGRRGRAGIRRGRERGSQKGNSGCNGTDREDGRFATIGILHGISRVQHACVRIL